MANNAPRIAAERNVAAQIVINGADHYQFMIGPDAFAAENTLTQIPDNKWICLFKGFEIRHVVEVCLSDSKIGSYLPQPAAVAFTADNAGFGMFCYHQPGNIAAVFDNAVGCGLNHHVRGGRGDARGHKTSGFFIFHQAHAAGAERF